MPKIIHYCWLGSGEKPFMREGLLFRKNMAYSIICCIFASETAVSEMAVSALDVLNNNRV